MKSFALLLLVLGMPGLQSPETPAPQTSLAPLSPTVTLTPRVAGTIDLTKVKGLVRRLSWSPDGSELYLQTYDQNKDASVKQLYHYVVSPANGALTKVAEEPAWSADYWMWKSWKSAPGDDKFEIQLSSETKRVTATSTPMGGDMARGGTGGDATGVSMETMGMAANQQQMNDIRTMKLKGEVIGEWINLPIAPGQTFGWGPTGTGIVAYADQKGKLILMDKSGSKRKVDDTAGVVLPAWNVDATRLAWLESRGKKLYALVVADVAR